MIFENLKKLFAPQEHHLVANTLYRSIWSTIWYGGFGLLMVAFAGYCFTVLFLKGGWIQKIIGTLFGFTALSIGGVLLKMQGYELYSTIYLRLFGHRTQGILTRVKYEYKKSPKGTNLSKYYLEVDYPVWNGKQEKETIHNANWVWENHRYADELTEGKEVAILFHPLKPLQAVIEWRPRKNAKYIDLSLPNDSEF